MKKILIILIVIILILIASLLIYKKASNKEGNIENEITPIQEMTEEQERQTMISLYYTNMETNTLMPEARKIDAKELLENPYKTLVELLIEKPKNEKLKSSIPEGTKVNNAVLKNDIVELDLSKEFIENQSANLDEISLSIYSIVNTLTELNEVNAIKILIEGEENKKYNNVDFSLENTFIRKD